MTTLIGAKADRTQNPVGNVRRAGNLEERAAGVNHGDSVQKASGAERNRRVCIRFAGRENNEKVHVLRRQGGGVEDEDALFATSEIRKAGSERTLSVRGLRNAGVYGVERSPRLSATSARTGASDG